MDFISDYKDNDRLRGEFNRLTREVFGFDFENWYRNGFWDHRYVSHSFFEGERIVSNVSTTRFRLVIRGKPYHAIQIGTVMTQKDFRGQGLGVRLTKRVIEKYKTEVDFFYLFGHRQVWEYYKKQDFIPINESKYSIAVDNNVKSSSKEPFRKLDISNNKDLEIIKRLTRNRVPVSRVFGVLRDTSVFLFYCLYSYSRHLYYWEEKDCLLVFTAGPEGIVRLFDVLSEKVLDFTEIKSLICSQAQEVKKIIFHFTPSYPDLIVEPGEAPSEDKMFFIGDVSILPKRFLYPKIAHT